MPYTRYDRERDRIAGPKTSRAFFIIFGFAMLVGLILGLLWVGAGLLHFHVFG